MRRGTMVVAVVLTVLLVLAGSADAKVSKACKNALADADIVKTILTQQLEADQAHADRIATAIRQHATEVQVSSSYVSTLNSTTALLNALTASSNTLTAATNDTTTTLTLLLKEYRLDSAKCRGGN